MAVISDREELGHTTSLAENSRMFGWVKRHLDYVHLIGRQAAEMIHLHGTQAYQTARAEGASARDRGDTAAARSFCRVAAAIARIERVSTPDPSILLHH